MCLVFVNKYAPCMGNCLERTSDWLDDDADDVDSVRFKEFTSLIWSAKQPTVEGDIRLDLLEMQHLAMTSDTEA